METEPKKINLFPHVSPVIFSSLPKTRFESNSMNATKAYDAANDVDGVDCSNAFPECSSSIWSDDFIF